MFEYTPLWEVISLEGLSYVTADGKYLEEERTIIKPRLEAAGYFDIEFLPGETDSFGPLTRTVVAYDADGHKEKFYYG